MWMDMKASLCTCNSGLKFELLLDHLLILLFLVKAAVQERPSDV